ncbi:hypothetical protein BO70DRAFT_357585 [Aspergillus heteromorphus CBS 117.55]|uniref:Uncharacterized protein n=1 Tax=Aspergillus heteromorphus CBS 117.55 TaxID=1448321 RepID=A0A317X1J5_9EURO|nr:uncharacterized protein BO70DRAFT_357585 [Aspergillus heteromorphus CBS 117.55]PWY92446.1 hypothetical protein BO70DRAFT_357585 [Aspergillus heteromorphus CBS 117.55]
MSSHTSPVKDGRRVLGEKPANACLSPARHPHRHASASPLKRPFLDSSSSPKKLLPSPLFAGQKRSIDQVEDATDGQDHRAPTPSSDGRPHAAPDSQDDTPQTHSTLAHPQVQPRATGSDVPVLDSDKQQQSQEQQSPAHPEPTQQDTTPQCTPAVPEDPATRKRFIQEKATLLRTRLQTAMRHVRDPQFDRRVSELEAHSRKHPRLSLPSTTTTTYNRADQTTPTQTKALPNANFTSNTTTPRPAPSQPQQVQQPTITVSGLSSPPLSAPAAEDDPMKTPTQKSHNHNSSQRTTTGSPMQLSSPPATVSRRRTVEFGAREEQEHDDEGMEMEMEREEDMEMEMQGDMDEDEMQMSQPERQRRLSQKGDAVDGLLKLMKTADQHTVENLEVWSG